MLLHIELKTPHSQRGTVAQCAHTTLSTLHSCTVSGCAKRSLTDGGRLPLPNPLTPPKTLKARQSQKDQKPKDIAAAHLTPGSKHFPDQNPQRRGSETQQKHQQHIFSATTKEKIVTRSPPTEKKSKLYLYLPQTRVKADQRKISLPGNSPYKAIKVG